MVSWDIHANGILFCVSLSCVSFIRLTSLLSCSVTEVIFSLLSSPCTNETEQATGVQKTARVEFLKLYSANSLVKLSSFLCLHCV